MDDLVLCDDSYLCWDIARRWAGGHPMTQDGIHFTNGFQPLWVFLLIPVFSFFPSDPILPGKIALVLLALFNVATGVFLFLLVKEVASRKGAFFALFLWMASPYVIVQGINGMETALVILLMAITLWFYLTRVRDKPYSWRRFLVLGLLAGLTMLARLDQAFLLLALGIDVLWKRRKKALAPFALVGLGFLAMLSPWFLLSYHYTGSLIPVSGKAVRFISLAELRWRGIPEWQWNFKMLRNILVCWVNAPLPLMSVTRSLAEKLLCPRRMFYGALALLCGLTLWALWRRTSLEVRQRAGRLSFLWVFAAGFLGFYAFYIYTYWYHDRYQAPTTFLITMFYGILFAWAPYWGRQLLWIATPLFLLSGFWTIEAREAVPNGYARIGTYVAENFVPGTKIGTYQSGAMGYFARDKIVINLDGVVNEEALCAHKENRPFDYIRAEGIEFLIDPDLIIKQMLFQFNSEELKESDLVRIGAVPGIITQTQLWAVYKVILREEGLAR